MRVANRCLKAFVAKPEVKRLGALYHSRQQKLAKQHLTRRLPRREFDVEAGFVPKIAAFITGAEMKGDGMAIPLSAV